MKPIRSEDVHALYPQAPEMQPGLRLFALHAADGTPILVTDSREAAVANAMTHELKPSACTDAATRSACRTGANFCVVIPDRAKARAIRNP